MRSRVGPPAAKISLRKRLKEGRGVDLINYEIKHVQSQLVGAQTEVIYTRAARALPEHAAT
jgi:hypothetical protein